MEKVKRFLIENFYENQLLSGILILISVILAMIIANSVAAEIYFKMLALKLTISIGNLSLSKSLLLWINEGLMTIFFLLIGFEVKREIIAGELSKLKNAIFPVIAAIGGMLLPILIFILFNYNKETFCGWGIPMSTDIAFTLGLMLLLKNKISNPLKVSVTALAIIDDIGALVIIALFYSTQVSVGYLLIILFIILIIMIMNKLNITSGLLYIITGIVLWFLFMKSGIHPTISGVVLAFLIPSNTRINFNILTDKLKIHIGNVDHGFKNQEKHFELADSQSKESFKKINTLLKDVEPPLQRYERSLKGYVNLFIVPLFAFFNAGISFVDFNFLILLSPIALGIIVGLMIGKSTGIFLFAFLSVKSRVALLPEKSTWGKIYGVSWLSGIGFTMSIFIAELSFDQHEILNIAKISILIGSVLSAVIGYLIIYFSKDK